MSSISPTGPFTLGAPGPYAEGMPEAVRATADPDGCVVALGPYALGAPIRGKSEQPLPPLARSC